MHGDALNTRISAQAEQAGDPTKRERDACREERFPWEIESAAWYASADEKVVRERLHNRHSPAISLSRGGGGAKIRATLPLRR